MAYLPRILLLLPKYLERSVTGVPGSTRSNKKYFSCIPFLNYSSHLNSINCEKTLKPTTSSLSNEESQALEYESYHKKKLKFGVINFNDFLSPTKDIPEGILLKTFQEMYFIYLNNKKKKNFKMELKTFTMSSTFQNFCQILNNKLPTLSPCSLSAFCNIYYFGVSEASPLMRKIFTLILDNINSFSPLDKLELYLIVSKKPFEDVKECKYIKEVCEVYFSKVFEDELDYVKTNSLLISYLNKKVLPDLVKKLIIKSCLSKEKLKYTYQNHVIILLITLCRNNYNLISKNELLDFVRYCCELFTSKNLKKKTISAYKTLVQNDHSYYDEDICNLLVSKIRNEMFSRPDKIFCTTEISLMGYVDDDLTKYIVDFLLNVCVSSMPENQVYNAVNFLTRISYHEKGSDIQNIRKSLEMLNNLEDKLEFAKLCDWCQNLTFLGCDTRNLFTCIFKMARERFSKLILEKNVLSLHHFSKAYFADGYDPLDEETLTECLKAKLAKERLFPNVNLNEYFESEDFVLRNCTTSDKNFLDFVAVFGPNKKPINLSSYKTSGELFNIENIEKLPGSQMIVFQKFSDRQPIRFFNAPLISGVAKIFLKSFEQIDCSVVLLQEQFFNSSPETKKNFLTSQINEILEKK